MAFTFDRVPSRSSKSATMTSRTARGENAFALECRKTTSTAIARRRNAAIEGVKAKASPIASRRMIRTDGETFGMSLSSDCRNLVTFEELVGYRTVRSFGYISGSASRTRNRLRSTFRSLGMLIGLAGKRAFDRCGAVTRRSTRGVAPASELARSRRRDRPAVLRHGRRRRFVPGRGFRQGRLPDERGSRLNGRERARAPP